MFLPAAYGYVSRSRSVILGAALAIAITVPLATTGLLASPATASACIFHSKHHNKSSRQNPTDMKLVEILEGIHHYQLGSGQHVYVKHSTDQPIVTLDTWVETGSVNETDDTSGISHFLEHLLFKGTNRFHEGEIDRTLESLGGQFNAATSLDFTHYYVQMPTSAFKQVLDIHANMMLNASLPEDAVNRERKVVQEEINRALDNPQSRLIRTLTATLFKNHGYAFDTLGPKSLIASVPRDTIDDYYQYWYRPEHFHTIVIGNVDPETTAQQVADAFARNADVTPNKKSRYTPPQWPAVKAPQSPQVVVLEDDNVSQAYAVLGFLGPNARQTEDTFALDTGMMILGQGKSSRLHQTLKESERLVQGIGAGNWTQKQAGMAYVTAELPVEHLNDAHKKIWQQLQLAIQHGITADELTKAKTQTKKSYVFLNESTDGQAQNIGYNVTIASLKDYTDYDDGMANVTRRGVQQALASYLNPKQATAVVVVPKGSVDTDALKQQWLHTLNTTEWNNAPAKADSSSVPMDGTIIESTLSNGIQLIVKPRPDTDTVSVQWFVNGGRSTEAIPGVAALTAGLLEKGTHLRSQAELSKTLESKGMSISASANESSLQLSASSLKEEFGDLLWILRDVITQPRLSEEDLADLKTDMARSIQASQEQPASLALQTLQQHLYPHHGFGNVGDRIIYHLPLITRNDVLNYYHRHLTPDNSVVSVVGNVDAEELKRNLEAAFPASINAMATHTLQGKAIEAAAPRTAPPVAPLEASNTVRVSKPKQAATWVTQGWLAPAIEAKKDYAALKLINTVLGTGLSSRLFVELREKQGLAYVAASFYPSSDALSRFVMYIGTAPENEAKVLEGFATEIKRLQTTPLTPQELADAKQKLMGHFGLAHETNADQAYYLGLFEQLGAGYDFDAEYPALIEALTADDIQQAAQRLFNQPSVTVIVAPESVRTEESVVRDTP